MLGKAGVAVAPNEKDRQRRAIAEISLKGREILRINGNIKKKGESYESRFCGSE